MTVWPYKVYTPGNFGQLRRVGVVVVVVENWTVLLDGKGGGRV